MVLGHRIRTEWMGAEEEKSESEEKVNVWNEENGPVPRFGIA